MRIVRSAIVLLALVLISSYARWLLPVGWFPFDLFLLAVVLVAIRRTTMYSQLFGLAAGLTQDLFIGGVIGVFALSKMVVGFAVAGLKQFVMIRGVIQRTAVFIVATYADALLVAGTNAAFGLKPYWDTNELMIRAIANTVVGFFVVVYINRRDSVRLAERKYENA